MKHNKKAMVIILVAVVAVLAIVIAGIAIKNKTTESGFEAVQVGEGIVLTDISVVSVNFPEDGSEEQVENVLSAKFKNESEHMLQYAKIIVKLAGESYTFEITTIPAGEEVQAFELERKSAQQLDDIYVWAEYIVFFKEEPSLHKDELKIKISDGEITVKNTSDSDITGEISVFYKNIKDDIYHGGITYRLRIDGLKQGEKYTAEAPHASRKYSEAMFVTYEN